VILHARDDVGEVSKRVDPARFAGGDERVKPGDAHASVDITDEEVVLAAEREPPFILPMSARPAWCTIVGTPSSVARFRSHIANIGAARRLRCASRGRRGW